MRPAGAAEFDVEPVRLAAVVEDVVESHHLGVPGNPGVAVVVVGDQVADHRDVLGSFPDQETLRVVPLGMDRVVQRLAEDRVADCDLVRLIGGAARLVDRPADREVVEDNPVYVSEAAGDADAVARTGGWPARVVADPDPQVLGQHVVGVHCQGRTAQGDSGGGGGLAGDGDVGILNLQVRSELDGPADFKDNDPGTARLDGGPQRSAAAVVEIGHFEDLATAAGLGFSTEALGTGEDRQVAEGRIGRGSRIRVRHGVLGSRISAGAAFQHGTQHVGALELAGFGVARLHLEGMSASCQPFDGGGGSVEMVVLVHAVDEDVVAAVGSPIAAGGLGPGEDNIAATDLGGLQHRHGGCVGAGRLFGSGRSVVHKHCIQHVGTVEFAGLGEARLHLEGVLARRQPFDGGGEPSKMVILIHAIDEDVVAAVGSAVDSLGLGPGENEIVAADLDRFQNRHGGGVGARRLFRSGGRFLGGRSRFLGGGSRGGIQHGAQHVGAVELPGFGVARLHHKGVLAFGKAGDGFAQTAGAVLVVGVHAIDEDVVSAVGSSVNGIGLRPGQDKISADNLDRLHHRHGGGLGKGRLCGSGRSGGIQYGAQHVGAGKLPGFSETGLDHKGVLTFGQAGYGRVQAAGAVFFVGIHAVDENVVAAVRGTQRGRRLRPFKDEVGSAHLNSLHNRGGSGSMCILSGPGDKAEADQKHADGLQDEVFSFSDTVVNLFTH